ncbi:hypothetical protein K8F61_05125 [Microbacterium resistens]|uniref:DUF3097 family protein n=1 Tax=Microbacterium resistens TaxID=156977 RepID=A0ABY3RU17_9MICO|nr:hypothetical protein [Microbacterium resistens]UGS27572.1 hypothetical protein K8F61_05125 [Microbacterium resistens]
MDVSDRVGEVVAVRNPRLTDAEWRGMLVAYTDGPAVLVDTSAGRVMLPAEWVLPVA